ncbi:hypothetical protein C7H19_15110 [Aphanothece hegewaldii CCALA 016]|uniref:Uncharacterized protein n=1 Tax=Aphanothece hegewaldii CCALA 016 TaxID=2107694 RepID=A0A2T1LVK5_9CHRO|nr:hypothetical protein [Aphanothece hegewaldii]PSF35753.1 hypothetical protein C7H19_15110 [Aphanothece hegewaldii CCALA 016]
MIKYSIKRQYRRPIPANYHLTDFKLLEIFRQAVVEAYYLKNQEPTCLILLILNHPASQKPLINLMRVIFNQTAKSNLNYLIFRQVISSQLARRLLAVSIIELVRQYDFSEGKAQLVADEMINFITQVIKVVAQDIIEIIRNESFKIVQ